jgi:hypothetical protein
MVNPGLSRRLDQHGRRAGIAIGLTMVLVTVLLIGVFVTIYGRLDPVLSDFVAADVPTLPPPSIEPTAEPETDQGAAGVAAPTEAPGETAPAAVTATMVATTAPDAVPTATSAAFQPDYAIASGGGPINFRSAPSLNNEPITSLQPGEPLEFLGEERDDADNFADNGTWLLFRLEDGTEGWVREIDVDPTG